MQSKHRIVICWRFALQLFRVMVLNIFEYVVGIYRYHLSTFYTDKEIGVAYSYVSAGTALSQVHEANNVHASTAVQLPRQHSTDTLSCNPHALGTVTWTLQQRYIPDISLGHTLIFGETSWLHCHEPCHC